MKLSRPENWGAHVEKREREIERENTECFNWCFCILFICMLCYALKSSVSIQLYGSCFTGHVLFPVVLRFFFSLLAPSMHTLFFASGAVIVFVTHCLLIRNYPDIWSFFFSSSRNLKNDANVDGYLIVADKSEETILFVESQKHDYLNENDNWNACNLKCLYKMANIHDHKTIFRAYISLLAVRIKEIRGRQPNRDCSGKVRQRNSMRQKCIKYALVRNNLWSVTCHNIEIKKRSCCCCLVFFHILLPSLNFADIQMYITIIMYNVYIANADDKDILFPRSCS